VRQHRRQAQVFSHKLDDFAFPTMPGLFEGATMPTNTDNKAFLSLSRARGAEAEDGAFDSPGWWLTGGMALLIWTGLALLLTNA
jgi:hypothetical protein